MFLSVLVITIQQKYLTDKLAFLNRLIVNVKKSDPNFVKLSIFISQSTLNQQVVQLCRKIRAYSQIWSNYLTVLVPKMVCCSTFSIYVIIFRKLGIADRVIIFNYAFVFTGGIFAVTQICAQIVKNSQKIANENRRLFISFKQNFSEFGIINQLKAESFQLNRQFRPYAFKMFANYSITPSTFYLVILFLCELNMNWFCF